MNEFFFILTQLCKVYFLVKVNNALESLQLEYKNKNHSYLAHATIYNQKFEIF